MAAWLVGATFSFDKRPRHVIGLLCMSRKSPHQKFQHTPARQTRAQNIDSPHALLTAPSHPIIVYGAPTQNSQLSRKIPSTAHAAGLSLVSKKSSEPSSIYYARSHHRLSTTCVLLGRYNIDIPLHPLNISTAIIECPTTAQNKPSHAKTSYILVLRHYTLISRYIYMPLFVSPSRAHTTATCVRNYSILHAAQNRDIYIPPFSERKSSFRRTFFSRRLPSSSLQRSS